jgi:hypothetical protein
MPTPGEGLPSPVARSFRPQVLVRTVDDKDWLVSTGFPSMRACTCAAPEQLHW